MVQKPSGRIKLYAKHTNVSDTTQFLDCMSKYFIRDRPRLISLNLLGARRCETNRKAIFAWTKIKLDDMVKAQACVCSHRRRCDCAILKAIFAVHEFAQCIVDLDAATWHRDWLREGKFIVKVRGLTLEEAQRWSSLIIAEGHARALRACW